MFDLRHRRRELRDLKRIALIELAGSRNDVTGPEFSRAINSAALVFDDSPRVRQKLAAFHGVVVKRGADREVQTHLVALFRAMCDAADVPHSDLSDDFLLTPFNTAKR
jgi:hypothetical protein